MVSRSLGILAASIAPILVAVSCSRDSPESFQNGGLPIGSAGDQYVIPNLMDPTELADKNRAVILTDLVGLSVDDAKEWALESGFETVIVVPEPLGYPPDLEEFLPSKRVFLSANADNVVYEALAG